MAGKTFRPLWFLMESLFVSALWGVCYWVVLPYWASPPLQAPFILCGVFAATYLLYLSPVLIHGFSSYDTGFGTYSTCFVRIDTLLPATIALAKFSAVAGVLIVFVGIGVNGGNVPLIAWRKLPVRFFAYLPVALGQTFLFFHFFQARFKAVLTLQLADKSTPFLRKALVALATALVFSGFHLPNTVMMAFTAFAGFFWAWVYHDKPNAVAQTASHSFLAVLSTAFIGGNTRIGAFYKNPGLYPMRKLFPFLNEFLR